MTKINKHKTRERRVMGIDQDRIHNKLPTGPQTQAGLFGGFMKSMQAGKKTKKGYKEIRHVVEITHKAGTNVFVIKCTAACSRMRSPSYRCAAATRSAAQRASTL